MDSIENQLITPQDSELFNDEIFPHTLHMDEGWQFVVGDPEIYQNMDLLLVPDGKALDVGMGIGRTSLCLALNGMTVEGLENSQTHVDIVNRWSASGVPISSKLKDITRCRFGIEEYDTTIFSQTFVHFPSTESAYKVLQKGIKATKVGGHIYIRAVGIMDESYERYKIGIKNGYGTATKSEIDPNVFYDYCGCSGEIVYDAHLYLDPIELMGFLAKNGIQIVHSRVAPQEGQRNVMYGEDWHAPNYPGNEYAAITLLGRKL